MRKLILFNMIALDGYFEGIDHDLSWHNVDKEFNDFAIEQLKSADILFFGRVTYNMMADYWSTENAKSDDPTVASIMNNISKIVFSRTLSTASWKNTRLIKDNAIGEIKKLKSDSGKDIFIFGSSDLSVSIIDQIDEFRFIVSPVVLGKGKTILTGIKDRLDLELIKIKQFKNGNILLYYKHKNLIK